MRPPPEITVLCPEAPSGRGIRPAGGLRIGLLAGAGLLAVGAVLGWLLAPHLSRERDRPIAPRAGGIAAPGAQSGSAAPAAGAGPAGTAGDPAGPAPGRAGFVTSYADVIRVVMPVVVNIASVHVIQTYEYSPFLADPLFRQLFGDQLGGYAVPRRRLESSLGSGVIVGADGVILTNNHVVEAAAEVKVSLQDGRELEARVLGTDPRTDLAVLKVADGALPRAAFGNVDDLQVGDVVFAIGNPFGLGGTVTMGIVSALGRGRLGITDVEDFIQTDAAINPGNSGGALINARGELIGINTAIFSQSGGSNGIGFAIPVDMARAVLDSILEHGRVVRGYAGLYMQEVTPEIAHAFGLDAVAGVLVADADPNGPAARAGLRRGDILVSAAGRPIESLDDLRNRLARLKPGDRVPLQVVREGRRLDLTLTLGDPPAQPRRRRSSRP
jgi:Do/DeqQ family serine protease